MSSLGDALREARLPQAPGGHGPLGEPLEPGLDASPAWVSQTKLAELFDDGLGLVIATEQFLRIALEGAAANPLTHGSPLRFPRTCHPATARVPSRHAAGTAVMPLAKKSRHPTGNKGVADALVTALDRRPGSPKR